MSRDTLPSYLDQHMCYRGTECWYVHSQPNEPERKETMIEKANCADTSGKTDVKEETHVAPMVRPNAETGIAESAAPYLYLSTL